MDSLFTNCLASLLLPRDVEETVGPTTHDDSWVRAAPSTGPMTRAAPSPPEHQELTKKIMQGNANINTSHKPAKKKKSQREIIFATLEPIWKSHSSLKKKKKVGILKQKHPAQRRKFRKHEVLAQEETRGSMGRAVVLTTTSLVTAGERLTRPYIRRSTTTRSLSQLLSQLMA